MTAARLVRPGAAGEAARESAGNPVVVIEDGIVTEITTQARAELPVGPILDYPGATLAPAFFDVHIHGSGGHDVMEGTPEAVNAIGGFLAARGVGAYFATTVSAPADSILRSLSRLARVIGEAEQAGHAGVGEGPVRARALGIHVEGPFLSHAKRGAHSAEDLLPPTVAFFERMRQAAEGHIRLMTIAPELPGAIEVIEHAAALGVRVSLGHTNATDAEARAAIGAGAVSATHTFNAMRRFDHRDPGVLGAVLNDDALFAEIICDGLHVDPAVVSLFLRAKGPERAILVTDAMSGTGMPDGTYKLGELDVRLVHGRCVVGEGTLAGSTLTMNRALHNLMLFTGASLDTAAAAASANPARMAGVDDRLGAIAVGRRADIAVLTPDGQLITTLLGGRAAG